MRSVTSETGEPVTATTAAAAATAAEPVPLLDVRELVTGFATESGFVRAVDGISFSIEEGEALAMVGESGCGKSLTAMSIMRLIDPPGRIVGGEIRFRGENLLDLPPKAMRTYRGRRIAMIFQEPMTSLNPVFTIGDQVSEAIRIHQKLSKKDALSRAAEMLELVAIPDPVKRLRDYPHQLSGGMRQRVMIAMALSCEPELLIADEPTTALDVTIQAQIMEILGDLQKKMRLAVLLITHDLGVVAEFCRRALVMYTGRIVEEAPVEALFRDPRHPYTKGLLASLPRLDGDPDAKLETIPGNVPSIGRLPLGCRFSTRCPSVMEICREKEPEHFAVDGDRRSRCWLEDPEVTA